jgi:hypothetical protein
MDSNFQVIIQANVESLRKTIKEAQGVLGQFEVSANKAAAATKGVEREANRGRLAAFAFGQVIRDAGFFSQSFGLGLLAISNNIPILIDQLVLLSKVSERLGGAISLAGSILTALLTVWAYSASAVDKTTKSVDDYVKKLDDVREAQLNASIAADGEIRKLELLRRAAQNETFSRKERLKAVKELKDEFPDYYASLSAETIMAGKDANAHYELAKAIKAVAEAEAYKELIKENRKVELTDNQKLIDLQAEKVKLQKQLNVLSKAPTGITGSKTGVNNKLQGLILEKTNQIYAVDQEINTIAKERNKARSNNLALEEKLLQTLEKQKKVSVITGNVGGDAVDIDTPKESPIDKLNKDLLAINLDPTLSKLDAVKAKINAYQTALGSLTDDGYSKNKKAIDGVILSLGKLGTQLTGLTQSQANQKAFNETLLQFDKITQDLANRRLDIYSSFNTSESQKIKNDIEQTSDALIKLQALFSKAAPSLAILDAGKFIETQQQIDELIAKLAKLGIAFTTATNAETSAANLKAFNDSVSKILQEGTISAISSTLMAVGEAIAVSGNAADAAGAALLNTIANIAQQLGELAIGVGLGIEAIKASFKNFGGIGAILAGVALLALAGYARGRASEISKAASNKSGGGSSNPTSGSYGGVRPFASGGIISGDTLGLMGEYPNARSNPEVVAPLDKLTSLISGSLGDMGGNMGGQLTARISGNDLVILLDRASKNRKNYF